jgi:hypothetical protein
MTDPFRDNALDWSNNYGILIAKYILDHIEESNPFLGELYPKAFEALRHAYGATKHNYNPKLKTTMSDFPKDYNTWTTLSGTVGEVVDTSNISEQTFEKLKIIRSSLLTRLLQEVFNTFDVEKYTGDVKKLIVEKAALHKASVQADLIGYMQHQKNKTALSGNELNNGIACYDKYYSWRRAVWKCYNLHQSKQRHAEEEPCGKMDSLRRAVSKCYTLHQSKQRHAEEEPCREMDSLEKLLNACIYPNS